VSTTLSHRHSETQVTACMNKSMFTKRVAKQIRPAGMQNQNGPTDDIILLNTSDWSWVYVEVSHLSALFQEGR
jgi:hypothetical protein